jgi:hypothetical protein
MPIPEQTTDSDVIRLPVTGDLDAAASEQEVVDLLTVTLEEEKQTDLKLTEVTEQAIMPAAMEDGAEEESAARKKPARAKAG